MAEVRRVSVAEVRKTSVAEVRRVSVAEVRRTSVAGGSGDGAARMGSGHGSRKPVPGQIIGHVVASARGLE